MKILDSKFKTKNSRKKKSVPDYSSWDPFTQAKYLFELGQQIGPKISMQEAYKRALQATELDEC